MPRRPHEPTPSILVLALLAGLATDVAARGSAPPDPLFELVPPDAALTLSLEDLRGHVREVARSPVVEGLGRLPAFRELLRSEAAGNLRAALGRVEGLLGVRAGAAVEGVLGEAVVLTLRVPPGGELEAARGLLLVRAPDPALLRRLVDGVNAAQARTGELAGLAERTQGGGVYHRRDFRNPARPAEFFATLPGRVFAWSNSEELIRGVIDRQGRDDPGLADEPGFREVHARLPGRALVRAYIDPRFVERVLDAAPAPETAGDRRALALLGRYLAAVRFAGAALSWEGGPVLRVEERLDPEKVADPIRQWAARHAEDLPTLRRVPSTAVALASAPVDLTAIADGLLALSDAGGRDASETFWVAARGLALGLDVREQVLPHLGPWAAAYVEHPAFAESSARFPMVLSVQVGRSSDGARAAAAADNALRTLLALSALDAKGDARPRLESRGEAGAVIHALDGGDAFAYALPEGRLILGSTAGAVSGAVAAQADRAAGDRFERLRSRGFPDASSFLCVDLGSLRAFVAGRRGALVPMLSRRRGSTEAEAARDLDQAAALIEVFDAAFVTGTIEADCTRAQQTIGLLPREETPRPDGSAAGPRP